MVVCLYLCCLHTRLDARFCEKRKMKQPQLPGSLQTDKVPHINQTNALQSLCEYCRVFGMGIKVKENTNDSSQGNRHLKRTNRSVKD